MMKNLLLLLASFILLSCNSEESKKLNSDEEELEIELKYATNFKLFKAKKYFRIQILDQKEIIEDFKVSENPKSKDVLKIPLKNYVCTSTTHLGYLLELGLRDKLLGFPSSNLISDSILHMRFNSKELVELGTAESMNIEKVIELKPSVLFDFPNPIVGSKRAIIENSGIEVINITEFYEEDALGKVEWIKLFGLLFGKEKESKEIFNLIENNFHSLVERSKDIKKHTTVFSGIVYGDSWYAPGGKSFTAKYYDLAGANYVWKDNKSTGSITMSFEKVFNEALGTEYWIGVGGVDDLEELISQNPKYKYFKAYKEKKIFSVYGGETIWGANPYFESGVIRPDIILQDIITIISGEANENNIIYHKRLN